MAYNHYILVCGGTGCESSNADGIYNNLLTEAKAAGVIDKVQIVKTGCFGFCEKGPIVKVLPEDSFYVEVKPGDAKEIINEQIVKGREVTRLLYNKEKKGIESVEEIEFYQKQLRIVLRNCGVINPENIEEYIARDGYLALEKALFQMTPQAIVDEVKASGLRGRGGAGFPTGMKWEAGLKAQGDVKYVVCNADEGDPGAYMDRSTIEGDPHSVIESMIICGKAIGANQGFVYIRAEYPLAVDRLKIALQQARESGLLGKNILGSGFDFDIEIRLGAGAFVCGEETALHPLHRGKARNADPEAPLSRAVGPLGKTDRHQQRRDLCERIPVILNEGSLLVQRKSEPRTPRERRSSRSPVRYRTRDSSKCRWARPSAKSSFEIGGGIKNGKKFKGVQTGGPSGGIITEESLDTPIDFGALTRLGSMMGSGGMIVMDEDDCVVDVSKFYMEFCVDESCGKCSPCRIGTRDRYTRFLEKISRGQGALEDLDKYEARLVSRCRRASLCALGQTAPNPTLSTIRKFEKRISSRTSTKRNAPPANANTSITYTDQRQVHRLRRMRAQSVPPTCIAGEKKCEAQDRSDEMPEMRRMLQRPASSTAIDVK